MSKEICMTNEQREIHRKKRVLEHAERVGNVNKTCRYYGVARSTFYLWRARYRELGDEGLKSRRRCAEGSRPLLVGEGAWVLAGTRAAGKSGRPAGSGPT